MNVLNTVIGAETVTMTAVEIEHRGGIADQGPDLDLDNVEAIAAPVVRMMMGGGSGALHHTGIGIRTIRGVE